MNLRQVNTPMPKVKIYTTSSCSYCVSAKSFLGRLGVPYQEINLDGNEGLRAELTVKNSGWRTVPMIFIGDEFIGGYRDMVGLHSENKLMPKLQP